MKKLWIKLAIWLLNKLATKVNMDFNKNEINDLLELAQMLEKKLGE